MDRTAALGALPRTYALALVWSGEGVPAAEVAERLGVPQEAIGPLLRIAEAKLARLVSDDDSGHGRFSVE